MKVIGEGQLRRDPQSAIQYQLAAPVDAFVIGISAMGDEVGVGELLWGCVMRDRSSQDMRLPCVTHLYSASLAISAGVFGAAATAERGRHRG